MSFFNFNTTLPRDSPHQSRAPGFGPVPDAFAGLSRRDLDEGGDVLDFEDTYDGLGDQIDDADDALNADTFGSTAVGKDFDFSGQTATMNDTLQDEEIFYSARRPDLKPSPPKSAKQPARTGYEKYAEPGYIPQLEASASIWGYQPERPVQSSRQAQGQSHVPPMDTVVRNMMSLEEVEADMRKRSAISKSPLPHPQHPIPTSAGNLPSAPGDSSRMYSSQPPHILQRAHQPPDARQGPGPSRSQPQIVAPQHLTDVVQSTAQGPLPLRHVKSPQEPPRHRQPVSNEGRPLQSTNQPRPPQPIEGPRGPQIATIHTRGPSYNGRIVSHPDQIANLTEEERAAFLEEEAKRARRNHKIYLLSRDNGLMTPQDKNFITRIQLQQLLTATGNVDEQGPDAVLAEDFYFHVYSQIRGAPRQSPNQPLSQFAQTYLYQTAGRVGNRRYPRGGESHMRRMEQQVQRAVEAAKLKPKNRQLVIEGSLGKISFSNARTPKPLLNLKRPESSDHRQQGIQRPRPVDHPASRKEALRNIEALYTAMLNMEDHERRMPAQTTEESSADEIQAQIEWRARIQELNEALWLALKVMDPIDPNSPLAHPFIAILYHPKGKKAIPRVFRQIDDQQRLTILTMIVIHLDILDVIKLAYPKSDEQQIPRSVRDEVDLFSQTVMPCLLGYINEASMDTVIGLVGLIIERINLPAIIRTKIGIGLLTMFLSRAELIKEAGHASDADKDQWSNLYDRLFDTLEGHLAETFTNPINSGDDVYVWQFLATMGIGAGPDQQQRLVLAVKDRVMDTVSLAKTLPEEVGRPRLENVNLFMRALGLDVELLG